MRGIKYLIIATDSHHNQTVYWSTVGWVQQRAHALPLTKERADAKQDILSNNLSIIDRFKDINIVAK